MKLCTDCGEVVPDNEAAAYGGRHENCWTKASASLMETWRTEISNMADNINGILDGTVQIVGVSKADVKGLVVSFRNGLGEAYADEVREGVK